VKELERKEVEAAAAAAEGPAFGAQSRTAVAGMTWRRRAMNNNGNVDAGPDDDSLRGVPSGGGNTPAAAPVPTLQLSPMPSSSTLAAPALAASPVTPERPPNSSQHLPLSPPALEPGFVTTAATAARSAPPLPRVVTAVALTRSASSSDHSSPPGVGPGPPGAGAAGGPGLLRRSNTSVKVGGCTGC
jgi:hypothetical protein